MSRRNKLVVILLPLLILLVGGLATSLLIRSRTAPQKEERVNPGVLVETRAARGREYRIVVEGGGTVQPRRQVNLIPQVAGRVVELAPAFVAGGFFREGELLFRIEEADYRFAVERAKAELARAEVSLATVESQARVARLEWERLALAAGGEPSPLVFYEPQLKNAKATIASAKAALGQARLDLKRTSVYAPFNCRIRSKQVEVGQVVQPGNPVAVLVGTDVAEVIIPLATKQLKWVEIPKTPEEKGSPVLLNPSDDQGGSIHWSGHLVRTLGEADPKSRMIRVVVAVEDPYGQGRKGKSVSLEQGMYVHAKISGRSLGNVYVVENRAKRDGDRVYLMDSEGLLRIRPVTVLREEETHTLVSDGLKDGDEIVLSGVVGAAEGMKLRKAEK